MTSVPPSVRENTFVATRQQTHADMCDPHMTLDICRQSSTEEDLLPASCQSIPTVKTAEAG